VASLWICYSLVYGGRLSTVPACLVLTILLAISPLVVWGVGLYSKNVSGGGPSTPQPNPPSRQIALNSFTGANQLANPAGLAVDNKGTLYVADHDNDRVLTLAAGSGQIPNHIPQFVGTYTLKWPTGVAVDNTGTLYVADSVHNRVLRLAAGTDSTPTEMKEFTGQYSLDGPLAVAVDNRLNVYVADTNHRRVLELAAGSKTPITLAFNDPPLLTPSAVAVDSSFNVYVADVDAKRVFELPNKVPAQQIPAFSYGLRGPKGIAVDSHDDVYVTDDSNQVLKLPAGSTTATQLAFTNLDGPTGVAVDNTGTLYVADWGNGGRVLKLPPG
jgi:serine/threonine protein kinase, bacterial